MRITKLGEKIGSGGQPAIWRVRVSDETDDKFTTVWSRLTEEGRLGYVKLF